MRKQQTMGEKIAGKVTLPTRNNLKRGSAVHTWMIPWKICALSPERMDATWSGSAAGRAWVQQAGQAGEDRWGQQAGHGRSRAVRKKQVGQQALDRLAAHRAVHGWAVLSRREPHHPATRALWWYNPKMTTKLTK